MNVNTAKIRRVYRPEENSVLVAVDRLRCCPTEVLDTFWPPARRKGGKETTLLQTREEKSLAIPAQNQGLAWTQMWVPAEV